MNKRGIILEASIFWGVFVLLGATAFIPPVKDNFRARKAVEICMQETKSSKQVCEVTVKTMTKEEILAYIKDDKIPAVALNYGNVNN